MKRFDGTKSAVFALAILITSFFFLSIDRYQSSYDKLKPLLSKTQQESLDVDNAMLKIRGGLKVDYDHLVIKTRQLEQLLASLQSPQLDELIRENDGNTLARLNVKFQEEIVLPLDKIEELILERVDVIEKFKSHFSILRNSRLIIFQLIDELRQQDLSNEEFSRDINSLERFVLHIMQFSESNYRQALKVELQRFKLNYADIEQSSIDDLIGFIINHSEIIFSAESTISSLVYSELSLAEQVNTEIESLESQLNLLSTEESQRALYYFYGLVVLSFFTLLFGILQARKSYRLTRQLSEQNENLESLVESRTGFLEAAKEKLQIEKQESDILFVELERSKTKLNALINNIHGCVYEYCVEDLNIRHISVGVEKIWGIPVADVTNVNTLRKAIHEADVQKYQAGIAEAIHNATSFNIEYRIVKSNDELIWLREMGTVIVSDDGSHYIVGIVVDINDFKKAGEHKIKMEEELAHAQKLESVGLLAAGLAHEINTPAQFISDNLIFLQESVKDVLHLVADMQDKTKGSDLDSLNQQIDELIEKADIGYLKDEIPMALEQSASGISRISIIVKAMQDYSQPSQLIGPADINSALKSTIIVSNTEWKHIANIETDFEENLPNVECVISDVNQVVLSMLVNAAHAIDEKQFDSEKLEGMIKVTTKSTDNEVVIEIEDNGIGMSESVKNKVFDQFFTTKEVGKGTGQGLSIAYRLIKDKHQGRIEISSEVGEGTTFRIIIPILNGQHDSVVV